MRPVNILLFTADDLNYNSVGCFGCPVDDITPNLARLAGEGIRFSNAHVTIAVCQPSRQCLLTGLYPHHNGALGFDPIRADVTTLPEVLREHGYLNGIIGKVEHCAPKEKFAWDYYNDVHNHAGNQGRSPYIYGRDSAEFFRQAKEAGRPFFLMANSHDPHRPFAGSEDELTRFYGYHTHASRHYTPDEAWVPGFLPDLPDVRRELAQYYSSVHRLDESVGAVLRSLDEAGLTDDTLVIFMSDNGMAFPFAKANCYLNSTKTPFIARWPGRIPAGRVNDDAMIAGVDFTATILEALGLSADLQTDGSSYLSALSGGEHAGQERVFTQFNSTAARGQYPMRCVQDKQYGYIFNAWADGACFYKNESKTGLTYRAMETAAAEDTAIAERVQMFNYRCREEFYDLARDPDALHNLIDDPHYRESIQRYQTLLYEYMRDTGDPVLPEFERLVRPV